MTKHADTDRARRALILGVNGQDGAYLARLLLDRGYEVYGGRREGSSNWRHGVLGVSDRIHYLNFDLSDAVSIDEVVSFAQPTEIYNLAGQSSVAASFEEPSACVRTNVVSVVSLLVSIRRRAPEAGLYHASSSELFGRVDTVPQTETTRFEPQTPYGVAKVSAHLMVKMYREIYGLHACCGILFNHESPLRDKSFVTRKITRGLAERCFGEGGPLKLGNLQAARDWGFAGDYVKGMWMMLQHPEPGEYILASGTAHSVRDFVEACLAKFDLQVVWEGVGLNERALSARDGRVLVEVDQLLFRPSDPNQLLGDATKARSILHWQPEVSFGKLVELMAESDRAGVTGFSQGRVRDGLHRLRIG
jgi:GDPmannose 4,6-dehydratase